MPKQITDHGLIDGEFEVSNGAIRALIRLYTREAGVRSLERELANLARKSVREISQKKFKTYNLCFPCPNLNIIVKREINKKIFDLQKNRLQELPQKNTRHIYLREESISAKKPTAPSY